MNCPRCNKPQDPTIPSLMHVAGNDNLMTQQSMRIAVAKACGWRTCKDELLVKGHYTNAWFHPDYSPLEGQQQPPDYPNDLNAAIQFAEHLREKHGIALSFNNINPNGLWTVTTANALTTVQNKSLSLAICEAGLKALYLWKERE